MTEQEQVTATELIAEKVMGWKKVEMCLRDKLNRGEFFTYSDMLYPQGSIFLRKDNGDIVGFDPFNESADALAVLEKIAETRGVQVQIADAQSGIPLRYRVCYVAGAGLCERLANGPPAATFCEAICLAAMEIAKA